MNSTCCTQFESRVKLTILSPGVVAARAYFKLQLLLTLVILTIVSGCSSMLPVTTPFGAVSGVDSRRSLSGLAVHKRMWELAGAKCLTPQKLSPRLEDDYDVIVLIGQSYSPPGIAARNWLEKWLSHADGRTVIYFGRDFSGEEYYRQRTIGQLSSEDRDRGEVELADTRVKEMNVRLQQLPESTFCRWFYLDADQPRRSYDEFTGVWAEELGDVAGTWPVGVTLQTPDRTWRRRKPSWLTKPTTTAAAEPRDQPLDDDDESENRIQRSRWEIDELQTPATWNAEFGRTAEASVLLAGDDELPLVYRLTHPKFGDGQILIVANGAPFLNGSLVSPLHRAVGTKIIQECLPAKRVALLAYDQSGILIASAADADARTAGLELFEWPLGAITIPALLLGFIVCIVLFPILGRPQALPQQSVADFGLHIDALGRMLWESRDAEYAKQAITEYYKMVRDEPPPYWLDSIANGQQSHAGPVGRTTAAALPPAAPPPVNDKTNSPNPQTRD